MERRLGEYIRELRMAKHLTQIQMAEQMGVSRQKYARMEGGAGNITLESLVKIAEILGVTTADLTIVLDRTPQVEYRSAAGSSADEILDMIDLFYANKNIYQKLTWAQDAEGVR